MIIKKQLKCTLLFVITIVGILGCNSTPAQSNDSALDIEEEYIDEKYSEEEYIDENANWLAGSWGITQRVDGGYKLDQSVDAGSAHWVAGAEEIVKNLPSSGHVITSFTHPAHAFLFTLRDNDNVDVAAIHPDMVPRLENEQIIFDVINVYRKAGKKVILYLNAAGPSMITDNDPENEREIKVAWEEYYNTQWNGDEGAAWRYLVEGYAKRFDGLVDGYWLDNVRKLPGSLSDFVDTLRSVDPTLAIGINEKKAYFTDASGEYLYVDSDGLDDQDDTDYKIIKHVPTNEYGDFTAGHITPLGRGAPPNSWGYEEYTIPDMQETPWDSYNGNKKALKHGWFPIRSTWSSSRSDLVFGIEQAYRFTRKITDAGAGITWSTTQDEGYMSADEMDIMIEIENRITQTPKANYEAYQRPVGAYLLGETP